MGVVLVVVVVVISMASQVYLGCPFVILMLILITR